MRVRLSFRRVAIGAALVEAGLLLGLLIYLAVADRALVVSFPTRESLRPARGHSALVIPVAGVRAAELKDTYGAARSGGRAHKGIDIFAARGTPVLAAAEGVIVRRDSSGAGGLSIYERGMDGTTIYYYAHLSGVRATYDTTRPRGQRITRLVFSDGTRLNIWTVGQPAAVPLPTPVPDPDPTPPRARPPKPPATPTQPEGTITMGAPPGAVSLPLWGGGCAIVDADRCFSSKTMARKGTMRRLHLGRPGGVFHVAYLETSDPNAGIGLELSAIAAIYAPSFEVPVAGDFDRFGELRWRRGPHTITCVRQRRRHR